MAKHREKGFTLIEALIGLAITAIIIGPASMAITTLLLNEGSATGQSAALPQVQNAGYWLSRDIQMARNVTPSGPQGFPLSLNIPIDTDENNDYSIDYLLDGDKLKRQVYDSSHILTSDTLIAQYIDTANTIFSVLDADAGLYKLTIIASADGSVVTRSYEIGQRLTAI